MPFTDDEIDVFFDACLAETAVYTPFGGTAVNIQVIFNGTEQDIAGLHGFAPIEGKKLTADLRISDMPSLRLNADTLQIRGTTYFIVAHAPDIAAGIMTVTLSTVQD